MSVEQLAVRAALETISKASTQSLVSSTRELYQANFAIAEALLSLKIRLRACCRSTRSGAMD
jgi:hypothetical protein